ncbi:hypothetical protein Scep_025841 [Stephania cephalantha]|uniref:Uncharacterized protein n=1 Tax=Stephania cephalantha TaxID=152367 RepID=A0AAP0EM92_9MAGN
MPTATEQQATTYEFTFLPEAMLIKEFIRFKPEFFMEAVTGGCWDMVTFTPVAAQAAESRGEHTCTSFRVLFVKSQNS